MDRWKRLLTDGSGCFPYREFVATDVMEALRMDGESTVRGCDLKAVVAYCLFKFGHFRATGILQHHASRIRVVGGWCTDIRQAQGLLPTNEFCDTRGVVIAGKRQALSAHGQKL